MSEFADAALVIIGHGSTVNDQSRDPVYQHASELRRRKLFADVREAFWKEDPRLDAVSASLTATERVFFAPLLISEGYFSEEAIPTALGFRTGQEQYWPRVRKLGQQTLYYCGPVGTHASMTDVLLARAGEVVKRFPFPRAPKTEETTLFIAGHGTEQNEDSRKSIDRQVELIQSKTTYAAVLPVFMEQPPLISDCLETASTKNVLVVPFFISDGMHVQEDIPVLLGEPKRLVQQRLQKGQPSWRNPTERKGKLVWYAPSVGTEPGIADVILQRVREAALLT
ncbi:MAG TPA: CbiX/SirB N-terminal domain-containing protein [Candidatus Dormibacteraeota bacterium]|nr:CbiX/SirB N-terminal domain-containing protein [Candidatus Dormibacteraeota bacterium]